MKSKQAELLPQLFDDILIPNAVWEEVTANQVDDAAQQLPIASWAQRVEPIAIPNEVLTWDLGRGESAVLGLALEQSNPDYTVILDDRAARNCAKSLGVPVIGTGRLLLLAKQRGAIQDVTPRL